MKSPGRSGFAHASTRRCRASRRRSWSSACAPNAAWWNILLGTTVDARAVEKRLTTALAGESELAPHLEIVAIPDAAALSGLATTLRTERAIPLWIEAGPKDAGLRVAIVRVGEPMDEAARSLLERAITNRLQTPTTIVDRAVPRFVDAQHGASEFLVGLGRMLEASENLSDVHICESEPPPTARAAPHVRREAETMHAALESLATRSRRLVVTPGEELRAELTQEPCVKAAVAPITGNYMGCVGASACRQMQRADALHPFENTKRSSAESRPGMAVSSRMIYRGAHTLNLACGAWLFGSAFQWAHSTPQFQNVVMVGFLVAVFALIAFVVPFARYLNSALAGWLLISAFALPSFQSATIFNSVLLGITIFVLSLIGTPEGDWPLDG
jgi:hypothetical protein